LARVEWSGLYEIIGGLNTAHPELSEAAKIDAARSVVRDLLERKQLEIGWLEWPEGRRPEAMETAQAIPLLDDPRSWQAGERYPALIAQSSW
jgi:hypothetical protein